MVFCFKSTKLDIPSALFIAVSVFILQASQVNSSCSKGCDLALARYNVSQGLNLTLISQYFAVPIPQLLSWNPSTLPDQDTVFAGTEINIPFRCDCLNPGEFLAHVFNYTISPGDTYDPVASTNYANLTTTPWLQRFNSYPATNIPDTGFLNVTVNCSCGDKAVSKDYGLFITWPVGPGDSYESVAAANNLSSSLIRSYNPNANFSSGRGLLFVPGRDQSGSYRPLTSRIVWWSCCWYICCSSGGIAPYRCLMSCNLQKEEGPENIIALKAIGS